MRRLAWLTLLIAVALAGAGAIAFASASASADDGAEPDRNARADYVIIAGSAGLRWDDIDVERTPTLWRLAERGSIGILTVRSAHRPTCPSDGWLTLGAGNYAARTQVDVTDQCPPLNVTIERSNDIRADLPDQAAVVARQQGLPYGAVPGALAEKVRCTTAVGTGAAIAAARPFGKIDRYAETLPADAEKLLSRCVLSIIDLGTVDADEPTARARQVAEVDALLARAEAARPDKSTIIVAGLADTDVTSRLHSVIVDGPGWDEGWLTSAKTGRAGYLELVDLAPTALKVLGRTAPKKVFVGHSATAAPGRPAELIAATAAGADADLQAASSRKVSTWFFAVLAAIQVTLYALAVPLLRRSYRHTGPPGPSGPPARVTATMEVLLTASALAVPASLIADLVPWWRFNQRGLIFGVATVSALTVLTLAVTRLPAWRRTLGPVGLVASIAAAVVGLDLLTGARLQLNGVAGYSALEGGRYAGLGTVAMGVFIAGALLTAGCLAQLAPAKSPQAVAVAGRSRAPRGLAALAQHRRSLVFAGIGAVGVVAVGSPFIGADAGGAVALTAGVCLAAALSTGGWLTFTRMAWATAAGVLVTIGFALIDIGRPADQQGSLGRFLNQLGDGTSGLTLHRTGTANVFAFATSPLTVLAVVAVIFGWSVLMRPWGGLKRLFGIYPAVKASVAGIGLAAVVAGLLGGAALNVVGTAAATALPLLTLGSLRGLAHAADRTRAVEEAQQLPPGVDPFERSTATPEVSLDTPEQLSGR